MSALHIDVPTNVYPVLYGSTAADGDLTLEGTSHVTKTTSYILLQPNGGSVRLGTQGVATVPLLFSAPLGSVTMTVPADAATHTIKLPSQDGLSGQFLRTDGAGQWSFAAVPGGGDALTSGKLSQFAATTSAELKGVISDETGSGALVFANTPTLVTPVLGVATVTSVNKLLITAPATSATLTIADGKTLAANATLTFSGTDGSTVAFGAGGTAAYVANKLSVFAATTSAELAGVISDETGSGALVFATSPTLTTPNLGTPSALTLTNATGLPIATGVAGLGAGIATFLATATSANLAAAISDETGTGSLVFATSPTLTTPNLGTPSALTLTNATGLPIATGVSGLGSGVAAFMATPSSANLAAAVTDETGSGALVFATSPTLTTPNIGAASGTSLTLSGLTSGRIPLVSTAGLLVDRSDILWNTAYTGPTGADPAHVSVLMPALNINHTRTATTGSYAATFSYVLVAPTSDLGTGNAINTSGFKARIGTLSTETHSIDLIEAADIFASHQGTGGYFTIIGSSPWAQTTNQSTGTNIIGVVGTAQQLHALAQVTYLRNIIAGDATMGPIRGTIGTWDGVLITAMDATNTSTSNRAAIRIDAMAGTTSTSDYTIYSAATQPSLFTGTLQSGVAGSARGAILLAGNTSGVVTVRPAAAAGTYNLTLPIAPTVASTFLMTDASGTCSWATPAAPSLFGSVHGTTVGASTTTYWTFGCRDTYSTTEAIRRVVMTRSGTAKGFYVDALSAQPASGALVITVRKNGAATAVTVTLAANGAAALLSDTTHSFTYVAGDYISVEFANAATGASSSIGAVSLDLVQS